MTSSVLNLQPFPYICIPLVVKFCKSQQWAKKMHLCWFQMLVVSFKMHISLPYLSVFFSVTLHFNFASVVIYLPKFVVTLFILCMFAVYINVLFEFWNFVSWILKLHNLFSAFSFYCFLLVSLPHIPTDFVFDVDISKLYFFVFRWCAEICNSSTDLEISTWSSAYRIVLLMRDYLTAGPH